MSSTVMYVAEANGEFSGSREFHNSHRGASFVWNALFAKYGTKRSAYDYVLKDENLDLLFKAVDSMDPCEKITLLSTADRVTVAGDDLLRVADAFDEFAAMHPPKPGYLESSLPEQASALRELHAQDPRPRAVAWNQTTVCEFQFNDVPVPCEACGCECGENRRAYSLDVDDSHWDLFSEDDGDDNG